jgi:phytoene dehydrogenase-like protein
MMTATYLARAGLDVLILEKGLEVGGDMNTESFTHPGYRHNLHSFYHIGVDKMPPFRDLDFERFHAHYATPDPQHALLLDDGRTVIGSLDVEKTAASVGAISAKDVAEDIGIDPWWNPLNFEEHLSALR